MKAIRHLGVVIRGVAGRGAKLIRQAANAAHTTNLITKSPESHLKRL
jgi:hypothetical protein